MIGKRIRKLRQKKGISMSELSKQAGVSKSYLSYIERDLQTNPSLQFLSKLAETLDTDIEYLLGTGSSAKVTREILDNEWAVLLKKAIDDGMSKEDFREYRDFINFRNWKNTRQERNVSE
ncbi:helix-turn-helix domain-containing protein [Bacillus luteolus]|uniref:Helix-turn-helix domain-containing protein n=1 Tax=Litchfieldia luteola TaxID=682179 RepID=A0ABR9QHG9_9BACI|nr:helix-turn-helix domain-containing protein [Cytobacillus luteolus]MBE4907939.1 helix-turn-helix domain-containing protein [Cytobacillus luteolus]MBP1942718.1 XRE family transcriptional regulator of biofilm formation [Cytobacillus luteolus]